MPKTRRKDDDTPNQRRKPKSRVASEIVESILDAAMELLASDGIDGLNTNRLAKRAGVSIGSLYQYFPNKEAIALALARRLESRAVSIFEERYAGVRDRPRHDMVLALATVLTSVELGPASARSVLMRDVPRRWVEPSIKHRDTIVRGALERIFSERSETIRRGDPALMALVTEWAVQGVIEGVLTTRPDLLGSPELAREIATLVARYLTPEDDRSSTA